MCLATVAISEASWHFILLVSMGGGGLNLKKNRHTSVTLALAGAEAEAGKSLGVQGQSGLQSKFEAS